MTAADAVADDACEAAEGAWDLLELEKPQASKYLEATVQSLVTCIECPICMEVMAEAASGYCGHCFCIGCFGCALSGSMTCPSCRAPVEDLVRHYNVEQLAAHVPALRGAVADISALVASLRRELCQARLRLEELKARGAERETAADDQLLEARRRIEELVEDRCQLRAQVSELQQHCAQADRIIAELSDYRTLREEQDRAASAKLPPTRSERDALRLPRASSAALSAAPQGEVDPAGELEQALLNVMHYINTMSRSTLGPTSQLFCPGGAKDEIWRELGLNLHGDAGSTPARSVVEFGVVRDCSEDAGQECMGNMAMGVSSDCRFKIEYYGSSHNIFSEIEVEGTVHVDGRRLLLKGVRSGSSKHYSGNDLNDAHSGKEEPLPVIHGMMCSQGDTTWIVLFDFSVRVRAPVFNSTDIILLKVYPGVQPLALAPHPLGSSSPPSHGGRRTLLREGGQSEFTKVLRRHGTHLWLDRVVLGHDD
eukprot:TRINITY_DN11094_c1_g1_i3.p1 TRINITY_DN11094_c1_g1~~TRINITY_DN11094_c1_g1_i3.p1  ORF type:complete len:482 (-),score=75.37 TRINITY_DN11094_c1_g1_i3:52-1497(-)